MALTRPRPASRCCSSPATCRPTASARCGRCTRPRASSSRSSAAASTTPPAASSDPGVPAPPRRPAPGPRPRRGRRPPRRDRHDAGRVALPAAYARRAAGRRPVPLLDRALGPHPHARASRRGAADAPHLPPRRRGRHLRPARQPRTCARTARATCTSRRRPSTSPSGRRRATRRRRGAVERAGFLALFAGRDAPGKGLPELLEAWTCSGLARRGGVLALAGVGPDRARTRARRARRSGARPPELRNFYAAADVLVVPSVPTRAFREPWGLVANEAMHQCTPRHRHRRRRRRSRRARPRRRHRARRPRPATRRAGARDAPPGGATAQLRERLAAAGREAASRLHLRGLRGGRQRGAGERRSGPMRLLASRAMVRAVAKIVLLAALFAAASVARRPRRLPRPDHGRLPRGRARRRHLQPEGLPRGARPTSPTTSSSTPTARRSCAARSSPPRARSPATAAPAPTEIDNLIAGAGGDPLAGATAQERTAVEQAVKQAASSGGEPVSVGGELVEPSSLGAGRVVAASASDLPAPLLGALVLALLGTLGLRRT